MQAFLSFVRQPGMSTLLFALVLIALNLATGIASAVKSRRFSVSYLPDFIGQDVEPYLAVVAPAMVLAFLTHQSPLVAVVGAHALLIPLYVEWLDSIVKNVGEFFGIYYAPALTVIRTLLKSLFPGEESAIDSELAKDLASGSTQPASPVPATPEAASAASAASAAGLTATATASVGASIAVSAQAPQA